MQPELVTSTYEAIDNPILRLLVYFLVAAVIGLSGAVVFLFKKYIELNRDNIRVLQDMNNNLDQVADAITDLKRT